MLGELYLRRTKDVELADDLPKKVERIVFCEPSELQKELYKHVIAQPDFMLLSLANAPCDCGVNQKVGRFFFGHPKSTCARQTNRTCLVF